MNSHRINSVKLMNFYLRRIRQLNPMLNAVITVSPTAHADARGGRHGAAQRRPPSAARDSDHRQGQRRHHRHADDSRLLGTRREHARRRVHRGRS